MEETRDSKIGRVIKERYEALRTKKVRAGWDKKLVSAGYVHHRDCYAGSEVEEQKVYTSDPEIYLDKYVSGIVGYLMPSSSEWFRFVPDEGVGNTKIADGTAMILDQRLLGASEYLTGLVSASLRRSNFYSEVRNVVKDWAVFGFGGIRCEEDYQGRLSFRSDDPMAFVVDDDEYTRLECFLRKFKMEADSIVRAYGSRCVLRVSKEKAKGNGISRDDGCEMYECIYRQGYFKGTREAGVFEFDGKWKHVIYSDEDDEVVYEKVLRDCPVAIPCRNRDSEGCFYGHGIVEECLPEIRNLNDTVNRKQIVIQKLANPPMAYNMSMKGKYSTRPDAQNFVADMSQRPMPIQTVIDVQYIAKEAYDQSEKLKYKMDVVLFESVMSSGDSRKTATEVQMVENKAILLLALNIDNLREQLIVPMLRRTLRLCLEHLYENSVDDRRSEELKELLRTVGMWNVELDSIFVKSLNTYLKSQGLNNTNMRLQMLASYYPQALQVLDMDNFARQIVASDGLPSFLIKDEAKVKKEREAMAQMQAEQFKAEQAQMLAKANADNAKAVMQ